jgi:hypothetical protein
VQLVSSLHMHTSAEIYMSQQPELACWVFGHHGLVLPSCNHDDLDDDSGMAGETNLKGRPSWSSAFPRWEGRVEVAKFFYEHNHSSVPSRSH